MASGIEALQLHCRCTKKKLPSHFSLGQNDSIGRSFKLHNNNSCLESEPNQDKSYKLNFCSV